MYSRSSVPHRVKRRHSSLCRDASPAKRICIVSGPNGLQRRIQLYENIGYSYPSLSASSSARRASAPASAGSPGRRHPADPYRRLAFSFSTQAGSAMYRLFPIFSSSCRDSSLPLNPSYQFDKYRREILPLLRRNAVPVLSQQWIVPQRAQASKPPLIGLMPLLEISDAAGLASISASKRVLKRLD